MMQKILILIFVIFIFEVSVFGNELIIMGGGGEPQGRGTIFDSALEKMLNFSNNTSDYNTTLSFNGNHVKTEEIIRTKFTGRGRNFGAFTKNNYDQIVDELILKIKKGFIKKGEKILIQIESHGAGKKPEEVSHSISVSGGQVEDFTSLKGAEMVSLDKLKTLSELAEIHGINLGILDFSCHSGNSIQLRNSKTCVISAAGINHFGYIGPHSFIDIFLSKMEEGKNLEEVFLESRRESAQSYNPDFPMISSPVGMKVQNEIYQNLSPYLNYYNDKSNYFMLYLDVFRDSDFICVHFDTFRDLMNLINNVESAINLQRVKNGKMDESFETLRYNIEEYNKIQVSYISRLRQLDTPELASVETIKHGSLEEKYRISDLLMIDFDDLINKKERELARFALNTKERDEIGKYIDFYEKIKERRNEIVSKNSKLLEYSNIMEEIRKNEADLSFRAGVIASGAKDFYNQYYHFLAEANDNVSNPCREFKL